MATSPAAPEQIGRYKILGELGRGAMGRVYRAFDPNIGRNIALKAIALDTAEPDLAMRFRREAQAAGILSHPNIVTIYDAGEDSGYLYIAMELVDGPTLQQMLARGPLPLEQVIPIAEQAGAALDHAHARAIIHRDIKPANIMVQQGVVKVADFGVARLGAAGMTSTGQVLGTPSYLAPEVVKGAAADARSDIFSLGAVLYELLTGQRAFAGDTLSTVIYRIISEQPLAPSQVNASLPTGLNYVLLKALAKDRDERYATCGEMVADLKNYRTLAEKGAVAAAPAAAPPPFPDLLAKTAKLDLGSSPPAAPDSGSVAQRPRDARARTRMVLAAASLAVLIVLTALLWRGRNTTGNTSAEPAVASALTGADRSADSSQRSPTSQVPGASSPAEEQRRLPADPGKPSPFGAAQPPAAGESPPEPSPTPATAAVAPIGRLVIHTSPAGARIRVDGEQTAYRTPVNFALAVGRHRITLERDGYEEVAQEVVVEANRSVEMRIELKRAAGGGLLRRLPFRR